MYFNYVTFLQGQVTFDDTGSRVFDDVMFFQYRLSANNSSLTRVLFASSHSINKSSAEFIYINGENNNSVFPRELYKTNKSYCISLSFGYFVYMQRVYHLMEYQFLRFSLTI